MSAMIKNTRNELEDFSLFFLRKKHTTKKHFTPRLTQMISAKKRKTKDFNRQKQI
jgi:hypothetical protein